VGSPMCWVAGDTGVGKNGHLLLKETEAGKNCKKQMHVKTDLKRQKQVNFNSKHLVELKNTRSQQLKIRRS